MNLINHESNLNHSSPLQTTSASFYNNLAPSAIGTSAIVSTPMLLSQSNDQACIDSIRNSNSFNNNQLINFEPPHLRSNQHQHHPHHHSHQNTQLSSINSSTNHIKTSSNSRLLNSSSSLSKEVPLRKFTCKYCSEV